MGISVILFEGDGDNLKITVLVKDLREEESIPKSFSPGSKNSFVPRMRKLFPGRGLGLVHRLRALRCKAGCGGVSLVVLPPRRRGSRPGLFADAPSPRAAQVGVSSSPEERPRFCWALVPRRMAVGRGWPARGLRRESLAGRHAGMKTVVSWAVVHGERGLHLEQHSTSHV